MLTWQRSGGSGAMLYACIDHRPFAQIGHGPAGWSVAWFHIKWPAEGWLEHYPSEEAAKKACEDFVRGLDIVPWD